MTATNNEGRRVLGTAAASTEQHAGWPDVAFAVALCACAVAGFGPTYGGMAWLIAGGAGIAVGAGVAVLGKRFRLDSLVMVAALLVGTVVVSGIVLSNRSVASAIPTVDSVVGLLKGIVVGWAQLLTTVPPVGEAGEVLAVPYYTALVASVVSVSFALRSDGLVRCLVAPVAAVLTSILFGIDEPGNLVAQGAIFAALVVAWAAYRRRGVQLQGAASAGRVRLLSGLAILGVAGVVAALVGSSVPGRADNRFILRDNADPPFDPREHPSPLAGYRHYTDDGSRQGLLEDVLFTVDGLPENTPIRLAVLDSFDGVVWNVGGGGTVSPGGIFTRIGGGVAPDVSGESAEVTFTIGAYRDIWVPNVGAVTDIDFGGERAADLSDSLRFNSTTNTGAVPLVLREGDTVTVNAVVEREPDPVELAGRPAGPGLAGSVPEIPENLRKLADQIASGDLAALPAADPAAEPNTDAAAADAATQYPGYDRIKAMSDYLGSSDEQIGFGYTDGREGQESASAGHSAGRLDDFVAAFYDPGVTFGNGEQYAATLALIARHYGVPSRVVMGFCEFGCAGGEVRGADLGAWVEVNIDGAGWVRLTATVPKDKTPKMEQPNKSPKADSAAQPPPPPVTTPLPEDTLKKDDNSDEPDDKSGASILAIVAAVLLYGSPIWIIAAMLGFIVWLKARRRRRRRRSGTPRERVAGSWAEILDVANDLGRPVPQRITRREAANFLGTKDAKQSANLVDRLIFGAAEPDEADVSEAWASTGATTAALLSSRSFTDRFRARFNPASLLKRPGRPTRSSAALRETVYSVAPSNISPDTATIGAGGDAMAAEARSVGDSADGGWWVGVGVAGDEPLANGDGSVDGSAQ